MPSLFQSAFYLGNLVNAVLYGIEVMLFFSTMRVLLQAKRQRTRSDVFFIFFSCALLFLSAVNLAVDEAFGQEMWILNYDYPGGPDAYLGEYASVWYETMGTTASISLNLLADGLMIYRCYVVWNAAYIAMVPCLLWISSLGLGITSLYLSGSPNGNYFAGLASRIVLCYNVTSVSLNIIATCLICGRLLHHARIIRKQLGDDAPRIYTHAVSIIIESALPYSISSIVFLITYGANSELSSLFLAFFAMFTAISPQMIIMRVVTGRAWSKTTATEITTVQFANANGSTSSNERVPTVDVVIQEEPKVGYSINEPIAIPKDFRMV
ncbi:hypothetical protein POSPLADRAFT_1148983 [Postia placenta MAD-698-R-SB12]|uniref:G protein-coupled receptor n=1 Tax=Postia placenta MAD-698-R-SB12 TaxID=670580 RepID=A0A1X6MUC3_9APHY|nr:hypothetical protein POSPLADRAFT_1148983 [Postia placenta MAD-698-R-SB12]OSX59975.1 hypothetical protein POSPLADRAFT_1148983 [Postia placenta MAD-698-R-SB12]